jgi:pimeloyl-ACP methyl ester carboxylesterase
MQSPTQPEATAPEHSAPGESLASVRRDYTADSDVLLIIFSGLKQNPSAIPGFSFVNVTAGLRAKKLFLRDLDKAWFLRGFRGETTNVEQSVEFLRAEMARAGARRVVLLGYSLGGFAALLYGALLNADAVHAFSPQTFLSFWKRLRFRDRRWRRYVWKLHFGNTRRFHDLRPILARGGRTQFHIYYAVNSRLDAVHAAHVRESPGVIHHAYPEGSHRLVTELRDAGELRAIMERAVAPESLRTPDQNG